MGCCCSTLPDDAEYYYECSAICYTSANGMPNNIGCAGKLLVWKEKMSYHTDSCCCSCFSFLKTPFHLIDHCQAATYIEHENLRRLFIRNGVDISHLVRIDFKHARVAYIALQNQQMTQEFVDTINFSVREYHGQKIAAV